MSLIKPLFLLLAAPLAMASPAWASEPYDEIQRRDLALIQLQLEQVVTVLERLEARQADQVGEADVYLDIPRARDDVGAIQRGLDDYLSPRRVPPRHLGTIEGDVVGSYLERRR